MDGSAAATAELNFGAMEFLVIATASILSIVSMWRVFSKAGQPGWASLVPIYNIVVMLQIAGKPWWWLLLMLVPFVNIMILVMTFLALARAFGKGAGFGLGLLLLGAVFFPLLAFGDAQYEGPPEPAHS